MTTSDTRMDGRKLKYRPTPLGLLPARSRAPIHSRAIEVASRIEDSTGPRAFPVCTIAEAIQQRLRPSSSCRGRQLERRATEVNAASCSGAIECWVQFGCSFVRNANESESASSINSRPIEKFESTSFGHAVTIAEKLCYLAREIREKGRIFATMGTREKD
jgi:hypothetical protein